MANMRPHAPQRQMRCEVALRIMAIEAMAAVDPDTIPSPKNTSDRTKQCFLPLLMCQWNLSAPHIHTQLSRL